MSNLYACRNELCAVLLFRRAIPHCPACFNGGFRIVEETTLDEIIRALDKRALPIEQMSLPLK